MIDIPFLKSVQKSFHASFGTPIIVLDKERRVQHALGSLFLFDLINNTDAGSRFCADKFEEIINTVKAPCIFDFIFGLSWACSPVIVHEKILSFVLFGPFLSQDVSEEDLRESCSRLGLDIEEVKDELKKMKHLDNTYLLNAASSFADILQTRGVEELKRSEKLERLDFLQKLSDAFVSSIDLTQIMSSALSYIVKTYKLTNCSIVLFSEDKRYAFRPLSDQLKSAEAAVMSHVKSLKNYLLVPDVSKNFMFEKIENIKDIRSALLAHPLILDRDLLGIIVLYRDSFPDDEFDMISLLAKRLAQSLATSSSFRKMRDFAITDKLTSLYNRSYFNEFFRREVERGRRNEKPTSLAIFDIDDFKKYNDSFGHSVGDEVLSALGRIIKDNIRSFDTACRYGGEEFCVIMPEVDSNEALVVAERLRKTVAEFRFGSFEDAFKPVTISVGLVTCMNSSLSPDDMLKEADSNLYQAKSQGKNKVCSSIVVDKTLGSIDVQKANSLYITHNSMF